MTNELIQFIALLLLMLVTGIFWGPWFALHRSMKVFSEAEFIHIVKTMSKNLGMPMRMLMPMCILFLSLSIWKYPFKTELGFYLTIAALLLILLSLIITIAVEVPIVKQIEQWSVETVPGNWRNIQNRWLKFHVIRTFSSIISFICSVAAILLLITYNTNTAEKLAYARDLEIIANDTPVKDTIDESKFYTTKDTLSIAIGNGDTAKYSKATFNEIVDKYPSLYEGEVNNPDINYYGTSNKEDFESEAGQDEYYVLYAYFLKQKNSGEKYDSCRKKLIAIYRNINELFKSFQYGGTYFGHQLYRISGYAEHSVYIYSQNKDHMEKTYSITKQKELYINSLRQLIKDEVSIDSYAENKSQRIDELNIIVDELDNQITDIFYLRQAQEFQYSNYQYY